MELLFVLLVLLLITKAGADIAVRVGQPALVGSCFAFLIPEIEREGQSERAGFGARRPTLSGLFGLPVSPALISGHRPRQLVDPDADDL